jgi:subtilase family serine protease
VLITLIPSLSFADSIHPFYDLVNISYAHDKGLTGEGVTVVIIDEGFVNLPQLNIKEHIVFGSNGILSQHGNKTAGAFRQIAPDADLYTISAGTKDEVNKAFRWCLANKNEIDIISISMGSDSPLYINYYYISQLIEEDIVIVAASGNRIGQYLYPAQFDGVFSVGGVMLDKSNNLVKSFHNDAAWVKLNFLASLVPTMDIYGKYVKASGTSFATPALAGMLALLEEEYPKLTNEKIFEMITKDNIKVENTIGIIPRYPKSSNEVKPEKPVVNEVSTLGEALKAYNDYYYSDRTSEKLYEDAQLKIKTMPKELKTLSEMLLGLLENMKPL